MQGANLLIYLGHGNGFPNPYNKVLTPLKVDGFGLNGSLTSGNTLTTYYGEYYVRTQVKLAPNAVVVLNHLCYSAGSSEPGRADPSLAVARRRVDNFAAGFLRTGAKAVFAETLGDVSYVIAGLFTSDQTIEQIFWSSWSTDGDLPEPLRLGADARDDGAHGPAGAHQVLPQRGRQARDDGDRLAGRDAHRVTRERPASFRL